MRIVVDHGLIFCTASLSYRERLVQIPRVLIDCGSASTIFNVDSVHEIGIAAELTDELETIRGVGGREVVFIRVVDKLAVGAREMSPFRSEFGGMDYGFPINGILGMDFLLPSRAIIDLGELDLSFRGSGADAKP